MEELVKKNGKRKLNVEEMWRIYLETSAPGAQIGEILRRYGMYPAELAKIRQRVEKGAKDELGKNRYRKKPLHIDYYEHEKVKADLAAKEKALAEMGQEYLILKKKVNLE
jgi:hypothetical protein